MTASRPKLHFTCQQGWINDPLGITWHDGQYHVFFQYLPNTDTWQPECRWGHYTAPNLTSWQEQSVALSPGEGDSGAWSGSLVIDEKNNAQIFYTAVTTPDFAVGRVRRATPSDRSWLQWEKGPVVVRACSDPAPTSFRDPFVFYDENRWWMLVGTALPAGEAAASCYSSTDLEQWRPEGIAASRNSAQREGTWTGTLWECPQLLELDGHHFLITSVWDADVLHHVAYAKGTWAHGQFQPESWHQLTHGPSYYAPSLFRDKDGCPALMFWMRNARGDDWAGALSVPHRVTLVDGLLALSPHPEIVAVAAGVSGSSTAQLFEWEPCERELVISGTKRYVLSGNEDEVAVLLDGVELARIRRTSTSVQVLLDGPTCEVWLGAAVFAIGDSQDITVARSA